MGSSYWPRVGIFMSAYGQFFMSADNGATLGLSWRAGYVRKGREMASKSGKSGDPSLLTDSDVDALAWRFLNSAYAEKTYADWPLDRRLDGFLRRRGMFRIAEDGDAYDLVLDRVMRHVGAASHSGFG